MEQIVCRPEEITYADTLEEDVLRRDFTVNGMAMNRFGEVIDLVGRRDIKRPDFANHWRNAQQQPPRVRCQLRACRFVAKFVFLPPKTY